MAGTNSLKVEISNTRDFDQTTLQVAQIRKVSPSNSWQADLKPPDLLTLISLSNCEC